MHVKSYFSQEVVFQLTETMSDPYTPLKKGLKGIVRRVDDIGTVHIQWENGSSLGVVLGDKIQLI